MVVKKKVSRRKAKITATKRNMKLYAGKGYFAYSPYTGEEYSATPGDYWDRPDNWRMKDSKGHGMYLVKKRVSYR